MLPGRLSSAGLTIRDLAVANARAIGIRNRVSDSVGETLGSYVH